MSIFELDKFELLYAHGRHIRKVTKEETKRTWFGGSKRIKVVEGGHPKFDTRNGDPFDPDETMQEYAAVYQQTFGLVGAYVYAKQHPHRATTPHILLCLEDHGSIDAPAECIEPRFDDSIEVPTAHLYFQANKERGVSTYFTHVKATLTFRDRAQAAEFMKCMDENSIALIRTRAAA